MRGCDTIAGMAEPLSTADEAAYDAWLKAKVVASLADDRPPTPHAEVMKQLRELIDTYRQAKPR